MLLTKSTQNGQNTIDLNIYSVFSVLVTQLLVCSHSGLCPQMMATHVYVDQLLGMIIPKWTHTFAITHQLLNAHVQTVLS